MSGGNGTENTNAFSGPRCDLLRCIHLGVAGTMWRDRAVAVLGEGAYRAVFSIASLPASYGS